MRSLLALLLFGFALAAQAAGVRVVTGGVGFEERAALERDPGYNLKVVAAMQGGQYLADVDVMILDAHGGAVVAARTDGPWLMAELPPGRYRLVAAYEGAWQTRDFTVSGGRTELVLRWNVAEPVFAGAGSTARSEPIR